jgi:CsgH protein
MFDKRKRFAARAAPLLLGLGMAAIAIGAGQAGSTDGPVRCEIQTTSANGMIVLEGVVRADAGVSGSYQFRVVGGGHAGGSNISQGGDFTAGPGGAVTLGKVMLGGSGAVYDASLTVTSNGVTVECTEHVGGPI